MLFRAKRLSEGIAYFHLILKRITLIEEQLSLESWGLQDIWWLTKPNLRGILFNLFYLF